MTDTEIAEKAREFYDDWRPMTQDSTDAMMAAFGRECMASAYEDAAKIMEEIDCYCCEHSEHPEGLCLIKAKAASLRTAQGGRL